MVFIRPARSALRPCRYRWHRPVLDALGAGNLIIPPLLALQAGSYHAGCHARLSDCSHRPARHGLYRCRVAGTAWAMAGACTLSLVSFVAAAYLAIGPCLAIPRNELRWRSKCCGAAAT